MTTNEKLVELLREARRLIHTALTIDALQHWACESNDGEVALDDEMRSLRTNIDAALAERQDSATDVVESDEVKWVWVNPSEYRAIVGAAKVGVWKQYDKELWAWEMRHRSKPYQCGEVKTEAEARRAATAAARGMK